MKILEIRHLSNEDLVTKLSDTRQEYNNIRFQVTTGQQTDTSRLAAMRHTIAQIETILRERQLNLNLELEAKAKEIKPKASKQSTKEAKNKTKEKATSDGVAIPSEEEQRKELAREESKRKAKLTTKESKAINSAASKKVANKVKPVKSKKTKEGDK
jgi:large subunit ribosomal protein L29